MTIYVQSISETRPSVPMDSAVDHMAEQTRHLTPDHTNSSNIADRDSGCEALPHVYLELDGQASPIHARRHHRRRVFLIVMAAILAVAILAAIIVPALICTVRGCPPKEEDVEETSDDTVMYRNAPLRLIYAFTVNVSIDDLIPSILKNYTASSQMNWSGLQIVESASAEILDLVQTEISQRMGE